MRNVVYAFLLLICVLTVNLTFLRDYDGEVIWYEQRQDTSVGVSTFIPSINVKLPRFYGDVLLYAPLTLLDVIDVFIVEPDVDLDSTPSYVRSSVDSANSLAVSYLHGLTDSGLELPVAFDAGVLGYDLSAYTIKSSINLKTLNLGLLDVTSKETFFGVVDALARTKLTATPTIELGSIVEVTAVEPTLQGSVLEKDVIYLWCYGVNERSAYCVDPTRVDTQFARIDLEAFTYQTATGAYKITGIYTGGF